MVKFRKINFSSFSKLDDLSRYSLQEISYLITDMKREDKVIGQINYVTWSNKDYIFVIEYDLKGSFIKINKQIWKECGQNSIDEFNFFNKRVINSIAKVFFLLSIIYIIFLLVYFIKVVV